MKNYLKKILKTCKSSAGFTLTELLIAASITSVVMGGAGWGLVNIIGANKTANAQTERRMELNRSIDFIADEVRQATAINRIVAPAVSKPSSTSTVEAGTVQSILVLEIPGFAQPVVYHVAQPKGSTWRGPRVLYRWGPNIKDDGTYSDQADIKDWNNYALVDLVEDAKPNPNPLCTSGWTPSPNVADRKGFYACIDSTRRIAEVYLLGRVTKAYGNSKTPHEVTSKVFARAYEVAGGGNNLFELDDGVITPTKPATFNFKVIGGSITCGAGGVTLPTTTDASIDNGSTWKPVSPSKPLSLEPSIGNKVLVRGNLNTKSCGTINKTYNSNDPVQVKALRDGDLVPNVKAFGNQTTIDEYLKDYIDPVTKRISIAGNEVIYLYEMGSTNPNEESFDLQDIVVLASIEPS